MEDANRAVWRPVKELFLAALDLPPGERGAFVDAACGAGDALRQDVLSLLHSDAEAGSFIERPAAALLAERDTRPFTLRLLPGAVLGRYETVEFLGAGGFGEVYRAHDARLDRVVAIKLASDPGDAQAGRARTRRRGSLDDLAQRVALGILEHDERGARHRAAVLRRTLGG